MILDSISNWERYRSLHSRFAVAFEFVSMPESLRLEPLGVGSQNSLRIPIRGDEVFALVQRYQPKPAEQAFWEAHRKYIDLQFVAEGEEKMLWAPLAEMSVIQAYDSERDFTKLTPKESDSSESQSLRVSQGMFAIFMPHDAHAPGIEVDSQPREVKKIVVKIAL